jgi:hypothetical protein
MFIKQSFRHIFYTTTILSRQLAHTCLQAPHHCPMHLFSDVDLFFSILTFSSSESVIFEVLTVVTMKNSVFRDVAPSGSCYTWRYGGVASTLKNWTTRYSETSILTRPRQRNFPEDGILHLSLLSNWNTRYLLIFSIAEAWERLGQVNEAARTHTIM